MTNRTITSVLVAVLGLAPLGCVSPQGPAEEEALGADAQAAVGSSTPVVVAPGDADASVKVKNGITVTLGAELAWRAGGPSGKELVLHGTASQDLGDVWGFIPDDAFGTAAKLGPRTFEMTYSSLSDIDTILSGERFFVVVFATSGGATHGYTAALTVAPHLVGIPGGATSSRLAYGTAITPEYVSDNPNGIHFRGTVTTTAIPQWLTVTAGANPALTQDAPHAWHFDWLFDTFIAAAQSSAPVETKGKFGATTSTRDARIAVRLSGVELALTSSPDDVWPLQECDPAVAACLAGLPAGTIDFSPCGPFRPVARCQ